MGMLGRSPWVARAGLRRRIAAVLALILVVLSVWPRPYQASALLAPDDSSAGLSGLFSGGGGVNLVSSLLGGRGTIEADLLVGRSNAVFAAVAQKLHDQGQYRGMSLDSLQARLHRKVEVESARGSILQISIEDYDPALARQIVEDFVVVLRERLTTLSRDQANEKMKIASKRMDDAARLYEQSQQTLNAYRATHSFSNPEIQQAFSQGTLVALQGQLQGAKTTLLTLEKTQGSDNVQLEAVRDRVLVLQKQIADIETGREAGSIQSLAKVNPEVAQYRNLLREEGFAQGRFDIYKRYVESLTVQEAAAPLNLAVIDPPFIDPRRHYNIIPMGLLALLIVLAVAAEFSLGSEYAPATGHRSDSDREQ
jgi:uncharacterized protein involved in exopolysaccharide biosynthesis